MPPSPPDPFSRPALFLDRDGVLNEDRGYVHRWEDFTWIPGARETVAAFNRAGWLVIVVTNQSGVGRGYYPEDDVHALHARMREDLARAGARIDAFYHAPQHPEAPVEAYRHPDPPLRKPNPGMLLQAMADWPIDREASLMIGDKPSDLEAALRAGVRGVLFEGGTCWNSCGTRTCCPREHGSELPAAPGRSGSGAVLEAWVPAFAGMSG
ncbi:HAD family hydrolase [Phenylobacterium sp. J426]|uniref:D-glycero-alpha-D-manno-heptose-1,7-bisphosphate 7-phosphatase n=1 Tax=Phenylobacterium sp. J426 TaxID=2898439 RepID=UPI0021510C20|nr:HAD family hydrolase [Phenylobacterium sp. J426]MCR5874111.1 HAD family hydrolase [Phenylobacterium sp. J426]